MTSVNIQPGSKSIALAQRAINLLLGVSRDLAKAASSDSNAPADNIDRLTLDTHEAISPLSDELLACGKLLGFAPAIQDQLLTVAGALQPREFSCNP
jgi:hypothetical protein